MKFIKKLLSVIIIALFCSLILTLSIRGIPGNPTERDVNNAVWKEDGPLELSPDRGRFALIMSIVQNNSFYFSVPIARFVTPDLGYANGKYVSLFAPGVSFLVMPGFIIGSWLGVSQVGSFAVISIFALINVLLIRALAIRIGTHPIAATISGLIFLFATPAFPYGVTLYQHHISTFLILACLYLLDRWNNFLSLFLIWFLIAAAIPIDYPNLFFLMPIGILALARFISIKAEKENIKISFQFWRLFSFIGVILPLTFFLWFNSVSYGNPLQMSGTVSSVRAIDEKGLPTAPEGAEKESIARLTNPDLQNKSAIRFFDPRRLLNGFYVHFLSPDRGMIIFTPVMFLGIIGMYLGYKKNLKLIPVSIAVVGITILLYSMWGDPWGGWAFGSRYLIPVYAVFSIYIGLILSEWRKKTAILFVIFILFLYSSMINTLGAITSNANPPEVEIQGLIKQSGIQQVATYQRNINFLNANKSKTFVYQTFANKYMNAWQYYGLVLSIILGCTTLYFIFLRLSK